MTVRVLVTRSEPGASETAQRLRTLGYEPVIEPVFHLQMLPFEMGAFDVLVFTSANGVRAFARESASRSSPVWCVGARTAAIAREAGFKSVSSTDGDVEDLSSHLLATLPRDQRVLHVGNEDSRGDLVGQLQTAGFAARFAAAYRAVAMDTPGPAFAAHLSGGDQFAAILIHSPRAGAITAGFARAASPPQDLAVAAISHAAAEPLLEVASRLEIAQAPNEDALLAALQRLLAKG